MLVSHFYGWSLQSALHGREGRGEQSSLAFKGSWNPKVFFKMLTYMNRLHIYVVLQRRTQISWKSFALSVHFSGHELNNIEYDNTWSAHERAVSAWNATMVLTTLTAWIIVHIRTGASMFHAFVSIFNILSCSKHEPALRLRTYHVFFKWNMHE